jgi:hypothetical protein
MHFSSRRLLGNSKQTVTVPVATRSNIVSASPIEKANTTLGHTSSQNAVLNERSKSRASTLKGRSTSSAPNMETADATPNVPGLNASISDIASRTFLQPVLREFMPESNDQYVPPVLLYNLYRDIYYHDSVAGSAVDIMSSLAFSDFNLVGLDDKQMLPFRLSVDNIRARRLFPQMSVEYNVNGIYIGQTPWDEEKKIFKNLIPHNPSFSYIRASPIFGQDPDVNVDFGGAMREISSANGRNKKNVKVDGLDEKMFNTRYDLNRDEMIYMTRRGMFRDVRGVSYYRRILPIWLLEKSLMRGTLDQSTKRQRAIAHISIGDEEWAPTADEMRMIADMYNNADLDPVGAVFVTRKGIDISDVRRGDDFWKWTDITDWSAALKMKALGINESLLSGDLTLNTLDMSLSVFIEQVRDHRDTITYETFYERMFPRIAAENNTRLKDGQRMAFTETAAKMIDLKKDADYHEMSAYETAATQVPDFDPTRHVFPRVAWHKRLRPEADSTYLEVLSTLEEKGVPIPIQFWASAGGMDIKSLINNLEEDGELRDKIKEWRKEHNPPPDDGSENASVKRIGLLNRNFEEIAEAFEPRNLTSDGKRKLLTQKGRKILVEKIHKKIAEAAAQVAEKENAKTKAELAKDTDNNTKKIYTPKKRKV